MLNTPLVAKLSNALVFQLCWFALVLYGEHGWVVVVVCLGCFALHMFWVQPKSGYPQSRFKKEWLLILGLGALGVLIDFGWSAFGVLDFGSVAGIPLWLVALWFCFATTLCHSIFWLAARPWLAAVLGGVAGAGSYFAGVELTSVEWGAQPWFSLLTIGCVWALLLPLYLLLAENFVMVDVIGGNSGRD